MFVDPNSKTKEQITNKIFCGNSKEVLQDFPSNSIDLVVTSPPYWNLRNYKHTNQIGMEKSPKDYITNLINIFRECKRVLKRTGSIWVNIADSYGTVSGGSDCHVKGDTRLYGDVPHTINRVASQDNKKKLQQKSLIGIPERFVIAMQDELNLIRRNTIIWHKPSCMPSSALDRFTIDFEYLYFFTKEQDYYFNTQYEPMKTFYKDNDLNYKGKAKKDYTSNGVQNPSDIKRRMLQAYNNKIYFGGTKYPNNQDSVTNPTYSGKEWKPNENLERIKRTVWSINTPNSIESHFATYPEELIEIPIKACTNTTDKSLILDPFLGSGTTAIKAQKMQRSYCGIDLNSDYVKIANRRLNNMITSYITRKNQND